MAAITARSFIFSKVKSSFSLCKSFFHFRHSPSESPLLLPTPSLNKPLSITPLFPRLLSTCPDPPPKRNTLVNFSLSDSDDSDSDDGPVTAPATKEIDKSKLPPPYDPFNKKPVIEEPDDPKNLQEVFHKIRSDGLMNNAVKMFDALSKDGLTHEALELFAEIKDKGNMPEVIAHTAVIEAYANAGEAKEAQRVYMRMLASGVAPNAYTYTLLIKALAGSGDGKLLGDAKKYLMEMLGKKIRPNAGTYVAVFQGFVKAGKEDEARELLRELKGCGFVPDKKAVSEVLRDVRGPAFRILMSILFSH